MEITQISKEFYLTQLSQQLKRSYDQRIQQLSKAFTLAIQRIQQSEVLHQMKGHDLAQYRIQHIAQISKQVINNEQELNMEHYMRNISQLKAQLAVHRMENSFGTKKTPEKDKELKKFKELEEEIKYLKKQIEIRDSQDLNLQNMVDKEIKKKIKIIQQQYILRDQHERILQEGEREWKERSKITKNGSIKEEREQVNKVMIEKYERILEVQRKRHEEAIRTQKEKYQYLIKQISKQNQSLKAKVDALQSKLRIMNQKAQQQRQQQRQKQRQRLDYRKQFQLRQQAQKREQPIESIQENISKILTQKSRTLKQFQLIDDIQQIEHFKSRVKRQNIYNCEDDTPSSGAVKHFKKIQQTPYQFQRLQSKRSSAHLQRVPDTNYLPQRPQISRGNVSPRWQDSKEPNSNFEKIQSSFAKQLAELRSKMSQKKQKPLSPDNKRYPQYNRQDSVKKRLQQTTTQYSPKYTIKNYHHY